MVQRGADGKLHEIPNSLRVGYHNPGSRIRSAFEAAQAEGSNVVSVSGTTDIGTVYDTVKAARVSKTPILAYSDNGRKMDPAVVAAFKAVQIMRPDAPVLIVDRDKLGAFVKDKSNPPEKRYAAITASGSTFSDGGKTYREKTGPHFDTFNPEFFTTTPTENIGYSVRDSKELLDLVAQAKIQLSDAEKARVTRIYTSFKRK